MLEDAFLTRLSGIVADLSVLGDNIPYNPNAPEFYSVMRIMQKIRARDLITWICQVLDRLAPFAMYPNYRQLIRLICYYVISSGQKITPEDVVIIKGKIKKILGEQNMSVILEQFRAEGKIEGKIEGEAEVLLRYLSRLDAVPEWVVKRIHSITDINELNSLIDIAWDCKSLDEFEKHLP